MQALVVGLLLIGMAAWGLHNQYMDFRRGDASNNGESTSLIDVLDWSNEPTRRDDSPIAFWYRTAFNALFYLGVALVGIIVAVWGQ